MKRCPLSGYAARHIAALMWRGSLCGVRAPHDRLTPGLPRGAPAVATFSSGILEDLEDGVLRPEAVRATGGHARARKSLPHHLDVCFCVAMCGRELGVAQPRLNRDEIHSCSQELHRQGVSEKMRRNTQLRERRYLDRGMCNGASNEMRRTETGEAFSAHADEDGTSLVAAQPALSAKRPQYAGEVCGEGHEALLSALATEERLVGWLESKISGVDSDGLGHACAGADEEEQERVVSAPLHRLPVRRIEHGREVWSR
jgi:hypothetical protein